MSNKGRSEVAKHERAITSLAARVHGVDVRTYESMPHDRLAAELQPIVCGLLSEANAVVVDLLRTCESESDDGAERNSILPGPYVPFEHAIDAAIGAQQTSSLQAVADIAFLAQLEMRQRAERLHHVSASKNAIAIIGECDSALRRITKALTSIDLAMARAGLVAPTLDFESELEVSLRVRAACGKLRARVLANGDPTRETLYLRLRGAGTAIAMLVGWEVYPLLRVHDRLQLRELQRRILDWLRQDRDPKEGMRLWQDLAGFMRLLVEVNRRQELVEHDRRVTEELSRRLGALDDDAVDDEVVSRVRALAGLDDEVDALLAAGTTRAVEWRAPLERLAVQMRTREASR